MADWLADWFQWNFGAKYHILLGSVLGLLWSVCVGKRKDTIFFFLHIPVNVRNCCVYSRKQDVWYSVDASLPSLPTLCCPLPPDMTLESDCTSPKAALHLKEYNYLLTTDPVHYFLLTFLITAVSRNLMEKFGLGRVQRCMHIISDIIFFSFFFIRAEPRVCLLVRACRSPCPGIRRRVEAVCASDPT